MRKNFKPAHFLVLVALLILILAPRPVAGGIDIRTAQRFEMANNHSGAANSYASAAARLPWLPFLWEKAGLNALQDGEGENAISFLNKAVASAAISKMGWLSLGTAYRQQDQLALAVNAWMKALPLVEATRELAIAQRSLGNFSLSINYWQQNISLQPEDAGAHYALGLLLMATAPREALPELLQSARLEPDLDPTVQGLRTALNKGLISNDPGFQFLLAGQALSALGEWDLAAEAFRQAVSMRYENGEAWAWLGEARQQLGLDGSSEMEKALTFGSQSAMVQGLFGLYLQRQGQLEAAENAFQKAASLEPSNPGWKIALGSVCEQTGDLVAAYEFYIQAVELAPQDASTWRALAVFSLDNEVDVADAGLPAARRLIGLAPESWQSYDLAGQAELILEQYSAAIIYLKKAVQMGSSQAAPALHLGLVYMQTGDRNMAQFYINLARSLDPEGPDGWQAGRLLEQYFP